jgi:peptide/nickel transport system permease protein
MSEAAYGRSYWEIVTRAFRRNVLARAALWISTAFIVAAILAPLLSNDRPYAFRGTMPGEYQRAFSQVTRGGFLALSTLPNQLASETERFETKAATWQQFKKRMDLDEIRATYQAFDRLRRHAEVTPAIRGRWIGEDVTIAEIEAELTAEEKPPFESARRRILADLPALYRSRRQEILAGLRKKLDEMADQLDPSYAPKAGQLAARFDEATAGDGTAAGGPRPAGAPAAAETPGPPQDARRAALNAILADLKSTFAPDRVRLAPVWRFPLFDAFSALDVFLIVALGFAALAFGPLAWAGLKRVQPLQRRWLIQIAIAALPAAAAALAFVALHRERFETVSYKTGVKDGAIAMERAVWPPHRYRYDEVPEDASEKRTAPGGAHPFGTDFMGRDLLARMLWGSRISLSIGFISTAIAVVIGIVLGALAGYYGGWVDIALSRFIEWMICFPRFFLILAVVAFLPPNILYVMVVLGVFGWMGIARLQRGEFLRLLNQDYVTAAAALGAREGRIMFRHLLPNSLAPVLVAASFGIASAMLIESGLSFLGFGVQEPATSWGQILHTAHGQKEWWVLVIPGAAIFLAVTCYNLVGDGIRDAVDPRLKL